MERPVARGSAVCGTWRRAVMGETMRLVESWSRRPARDVARVTREAAPDGVRPVAEPLG
ncbi:hypothetical protein [Actinomadura harenae]|uniref:hypothetical protein n=1 Tax=Actinomadura harenae TaxID=2483351 RepID=UPI0013152878|nr:hypothetical protein [Actinomadura harenae]